MHVCYFLSSKMQMFLLMRFSLRVCVCARVLCQLQTRLHTCNETPVVAVIKLFPITTGMQINRAIHYCVLGSEQSPGLVQQQQPPVLPLERDQLKKYCRYCFSGCRTQDVIRTKCNLSVLIPETKSLTPSEAKCFGHLCSIQQSHYCETSVSCTDARKR